jgi:proteasome component ECM29
MSASTEENDVQVLDSVLFRFATTDDDTAFESAVHRVLPRVLRMLNRDSVAIRNKVQEILQHINMRLKASPQITLPAADLVELLSEKESSSFLTSKNALDDLVVAFFVLMPSCFK